MVQENDHELAALGNEMWEQTSDMKNGCGSVLMSTRTPVGSFVHQSTRYQYPFEVCRGRGSRKTLEDSFH